MKSAIQKKETVASKSTSPFFNKEGNKFFASRNKSFYNAHAVQPKLTIGQPNDLYEKEADAMADQVVQRLSSPEAIQTKYIASASSILPFIQAKCAGCEEEEKVQRKGEGSGGLASPTIESQLNTSKGSGNALPDNTRQQMETSFGADFSGVKVHTGSSAIQMSKNLNAQAFTQGADIYFNEGKYNINSKSGQHLLAHELTHVVQQGSAKNNIPSQPSIQKTSEHQVMRSLALDSTVKICHRELVSRNIKVSQGGLRVVFLLNPHDTGIPNCQQHPFWVTLTKSEDWWPDNEITTCKGDTGGTRSFSFGNLPSGTYYLTINRIFDHPYCCIEGDILIFDEPISGDSSGCIRDKDPSAMDIVHGALDIAGFIPVLGAIPDGINAAIYVAEGDWANAGLSAVAMVPAWGDGVKLGVMAGKTTIKISEKAAIKLGEEGIAKGLKEVKAASKTGTGAVGAAEKTAKEAAEKALKDRIAECIAIHGAYKALGNCRSCSADDTPAERATKIACITAVIAGRGAYLKKDCDDVLEGSILRGSDKAKRGHQIQLEQFVKMLAKCSTLPTK